MSPQASAQYLMVALLPRREPRKISIAAPEDAGIPLLKVSTTAPEDAALPLLVQKFLALLDQKKTLTEACQTAGIPEQKGLEILHKLNTMGLPQPAQSTPFSELEEAFFASEVQPIDECDEPERGLFKTALVLIAQGLTRLRAQD